MTYHATAEMAPERRSIRAQLAATSRAVEAADQSHVREALDSVRWERRGLFQRLSHCPAS
jgi:hypothetical protein